MAFKESFSDYYTSKDGEKISFQTNFDFNKKKLSSKELLIVFNYGLVCSNAHWGPQLEFFDQLGYNILIHDYRGHYTSSGIENIENITFLTMAQDTLELILNLGTPLCLMLGHSMGVNVTLEFARQFPQHLIGQILISGSVLPPQDVMFDSNLFDLLLPYLLLIEKSFPSFFLSAWKNSYRNILVQKIIHQGGFNTKTVPIDFVELYLKRIGELPPKLFIQLITQMQKHDIINDLDKITTPTLIIGGDSDKVIPNYSQNIIHQHIKKSEIYILKDGSHVPQIDFPQFINNRIEIFLKKNWKN